MTPLPIVALPRGPEGPRPVTPWLARHSPTAAAPFSENRGEALFPHKRLRRGGVTWAAIAALLLTAAIALSAAAAPDILRSPDGRIEVAIQMETAVAGRGPEWSAQFQGRSVLAHCRLGLTVLNEGEVLSNITAITSQRRSIDETIPVLFGKSDQAKDRFQEIRYRLEGSQKRRIEVVFRCYDDAIAFRYELPGSPAESPVTITEESTSFGLADEPKAFVQYLENFTTSHEHNVVATPSREIKPSALLDLPLTVQWSDGTCAAITEGALRHYAGMSLSRRVNAGAPDELICQLTPRADGTKVVRSLPLRTPWRVVLISDRPGALLESQTLYCLNEPSAIGDSSWIKPGKITFPWWNGDVYDGKPGLPILSFEMARKYIDFCARQGIPIHALTSTETTTTPWYHQSQPGVVPGPDTDVTRPRDDFELERIRQYAQSKQIRLWTWVHQGALRGRVEEAFAAFEKLGWSGMMVDFFDHDDQESVEFAESILQAAARHHILIHFHGIWKPSGWQRTYPNLMNHEGALNLEYLKWSDLCTPEHDLMMAGTRLIAGPMDYHLGGFRAVPRAQFKPSNIAPHVLGTRAHMLALYVCFDNPTPMVADFPTAYEGQPGFDFVTQVPTWWNETRVLGAELGEWLVTARRKDSNWYLGGISAQRPRTTAIPLSFLPPGSYTVRLWQDSPDSAVDPNHLTLRNLAVTAQDRLEIQVALDGGFVAEIRPAVSTQKGPSRGAAE